MAELSRYGWEQAMDRLQAAIELERSTVQLVVDADGGAEGVLAQQDAVQVLDVLVARTVEEKAKGMLGRDFSDCDAMLFIEPVETHTSWHTVGMTEPILLALFDAYGEPVEVAELEPGVADFHAERPFKFALELPVSSKALLEGRRLVLP
jgi:uncharacterized membrane protein (UPF0127 family)